MGNLFKKHSLTIIMIGLFIMLYPFILKVVSVDVLPYDLEYYNRNQIADIFDVAKSRVLLAFTSLLLFSVGASLISDKKTKWKLPSYIIALIGSYGGLTLLSWVFSPYKDLGWRGAFDHYEGLLVLLSYLVLCSALVIIFKPKTSSNFIIPAFIASVTVMSLIGILQFVGYNPLELDLIKTIITWPADHQGLTYKDVVAVYGTIGNPNFLGSFLALTLPFLIIETCSGVTNKRKLFLSAATVICLSALFASSSRAAFTAVLLVLPGIGYCLGNNRKMDSRLFKIILSVQFALIWILKILMRASLNGTDFIIFNGILLAAFLISIVAAPIQSAVKKIGMKKMLIGSGLIVLLALGSAFAILPRASSEAWPLGKVENSAENKMEMTLYGEPVSLEYHQGKLTVLDKDNQVIADISKQGKFTITLPSGREITADLREDKNDKGIKGLVLQEPYILFILADTESGSKVFVADVKKVQTEPVSAPYFKPLGGFESAGSGRGYIWSRTLPLLPSRIFLGSGPDSFVPSFPQLDLAAKSAAFKNVYTIVDKPHSWYLQMAIHSGVIAALSIIALIGIVLTKLFHIIHENADDSDSFKFALMVFTSILAYAITSLFNDSVVGVAPLFWIVLGIGIALTVKVESETKSAKKVKRTVS